MLFLLFIANAIVFAKCRYVMLSEGAPVWGWMTSRQMTSRARLARRVIFLSFTLWFIASALIGSIGSA